MISLHHNQGTEIHEHLRQYRKLIREQRDASADKEEKRRLDQQMENITIHMKSVLGMQP